MKLEADANIWAASLDDLSGRDKGKIFAQRANVVIGEAHGDPKRYERLFRNGRVRRKVLSSLIGCHRSALLENPAIVTLLQNIEGRQAAGDEPCNDADGELEDTRPPESPEVVRALLKRLQQGCRISGREHEDWIIATDRTCRIDKQIYEISSILWSDGIDEHASDWLRHIVVTNAVNPSTARQYAKILRAFLRHCRDRRRDWITVDDNFLRAWRDGRRGKVDDLQVISDLNIVFQFYAWAETTGVLSYHVGIYDKEELPRGFRRFDFPITARRRLSRKGAVPTGWTTTLTFRASKAIEGRRNTPTDEQVISVHEQLLKGEQGERDALIAAWAEEAGSRRMEILQLRTDHLPSDDELQRLIANEESAEIEIKRRKRGSKAPIRANPYLIVATREWIEVGRQKIVNDCRRKIRRYREPKEIFLSSTTGKVLDPDSVTKTMGTAFKAAGVKKASLHRLRAKALVEEVEKYVDGFFEMGIVVEPGSQWAETILVRIAENAGQASALSLRPYLNFVLSRRLSLTEAHKQTRVAAKTRDLERRAAAAKAELQRDVELMAAVKLARSGKPDAAVRLLRILLEAHCTSSEPEIARRS